MGALALVLLGLSVAIGGAAPNPGAAPGPGAAPAGAAPAGAAPDTVPGIHERSAPVIDGRLDDWQSPSLPIPWQDGSPAAPRARFAYDSAALYLALEVPDDTVTFPPRSWRFGDGFYLTVLMPGGGAASRSHVSLGVSREGDRVGLTVVNRSGEYFPDMSRRGVRVAMHPDPGATPDWSSGVHAGRGTLTYELAVPWTLLAPADPLTADSLAVNVVVVDRDGGSARRFGMLEPDPGFDTERTPVRRGRLLPLVRRAPPATPRLGLRLPRPVLEAGTTVPVVVARRGPVPGLDGNSAPVTVALTRGDRTLASGLVGLAGGDPGRGEVRLRIPTGAGTGPATVRARSAGNVPARREVFVVDPGELAERRDRLERAEAAPRAAVPGALLRLGWLEACARDPRANAPLAEPAALWDRYRELEEELLLGSTASLRTPGRHLVAHRSRLDGSLQPYSVHLPEGYDPDTPGGYPLLVVLHGSGVDESGTIRSAGPPASRRGWIVAAPRGRGLSDWYVGPAGEDVIEVVDHVRGLYAVDPARTALLGFSMGGYGAWRLMALHPDRFQRVAVLSGAACPPETVAGECIDALLADRFPDDPKPPVLVVHGAADNAVPVEDARRLVRALDRLEWPHRYLEYEDAAHGSPDWWTLALDWLAGT